MNIEMPLQQALPFAQNPPLATLEDERILCNNIIFPGEFNPHNVRLWVIGNVYGAVAAVWADHEQDAFDEATDAGFMNCFLVSEDDQKEATEDERAEWAHLGNAGEPADLSDAWIGCVDLSKLPLPLIIRFAEARGAGNTTLLS